MIKHVVQVAKISRQFIRFIHLFFLSLFVFFKTALVI